MSRGLGKTQRGILDIVADGEWHWIDDMADSIYAEQWEQFQNEAHSIGEAIDKAYSTDWATIRAAKNLQKSGIVEFELLNRGAAIDYREGNTHRDGFNRRVRLRQELLSVGQRAQHLKSQVTGNMMLPVCMR